MANAGMVSRPCLSIASIPSLCFSTVAAASRRCIDGMAIGIASVRQPYGAHKLACAGGPGSLLPGRPLGLGKCRHGFHRLVLASKLANRKARVRSLAFPGDGERRAGCHLPGAIPLAAAGDVCIDSAQC